MLSRLNIHLQLIRQSTRLLLNRKSLLVFSVTAFLFMIALFFLTMLPIAKVEYLAWKTQQVTLQDYFFCLLLLFLFFFLAHLVSLLMNAGLIVCTLNQLRNRPFSILTGFKEAFAHFPEIFVWNLLMTTVGILIRALENTVDNWFRQKKVNDYLAGLTWLTATLFVLPLIAIENITAINAIKQSALLVKKQCAGHPFVYRGVVTTNIVLMLISFIPALIGLIIGGAIAVTTGSAITITCFSIITILFSASQTVLITALYAASKENSASPYYNNALLKQFFQTD